MRQLLYPRQVNHLLLAAAAALVDPLAMVLLAVALLVGKFFPVVVVVGQTGGPQGQQPVLLSVVMAGTVRAVLAAEQAQLQAVQQWLVQRGQAVVVVVAHCIQATLRGLLAQRGIRGHHPQPAQLLAPALEAGALALKTRLLVAGSADRAGTAAAALAVILAITWGLYLAGMALLSSRTVQLNQVVSLPFSKH